MTLFCPSISTIATILGSFVALLTAIHLTNTSTLVTSRLWVLTLEAFKSKVIDLFGLKCMSYVLIKHMVLQPKRRKINSAAYNAMSCNSHLATIASFIWAIYKIGRKKITAIFCFWAELYTALDVRNGVPGSTTIPPELLGLLTVPIASAKVFSFKRIRCIHQQPSAKEVSLWWFCQPFTSKNALVMNRFWSKVDRMCKRYLSKKMPSFFFPIFMIMGVSSTCKYEENPVST